VAFSGTVEMVLLPPIDTDNYEESGLMELLDRTRSVIADELSKPSEK